MRRPILSRLSPFWQKAAVLFFVFAMGVAFDRLTILVSPWWYRQVYVATIHGTKDKGCGGPAGYEYVRFGRPFGQDDGFFQTACHEHFWPSKDVALFCDCD